jgi:hypothetical protein
MTIGIFVVMAVPSITTVIVFLGIVGALCSYGQIRIAKKKINGSVTTK